MQGLAKNGSVENFAVYVGDEREGTIVVSPRDGTRRGLLGTDISVNFAKVAVDATGFEGDLRILHTHHDQMVSDIIERARNAPREPGQERSTRSLDEKERDLFAAPSIIDIRTALHDMPGRFLAESHGSQKKVHNDVITSSGVWGFRRLEDHSFVKGHDMMLDMVVSTIVRELRPVHGEIHAIFQSDDPENEGWKQLARTPEGSARLAAHLFVNNTPSTHRRAFEMVQSNLQQSRAKATVDQFRSVYGIGPIAAYQHVLEDQRKRILQGDTTFEEALASLKEIALQKGIELTYTPL
jgi:hypothetical protein